MIMSAFRNSQAKQGQCFRHLPIQYVCLALLSTMLFRSVHAHSTQTDVRVSELQFSAELSNPCYLVNTTDLQTDGSSTVNKNPEAHFEDLKVKASNVKEIAESVLSTNVLINCSMLQLPHVAAIPSPDEISGVSPLVALRLFYKSLLNHTAHVYFIPEQLVRYSDDNCNSPGLYDNITSLGYDMRGLMCSVRLGVFSLQDKKDDSLEDATRQILNEKLFNQPMCSRRSIRDCQVVASTVTLLRNLFDYVENEVVVTTVGTTC